MGLIKRQPRHSTYSLSFSQQIYKKNRNPIQLYRLKNKALSSSHPTTIGSQISLKSDLFKDSLFKMELIIIKIRKMCVWTYFSFFPNLKSTPFTKDTRSVSDNSWWPSGIKPEWLCVELSQMGLSKGNNIYFNRISARSCFGD